MKVLCFLQSIASARSEVSSNLGPVQDEINNLHNQTIDRINNYESEYVPTAQYYDKM